MSEWKKTEPATPKSHKFTCPFCGRYCYDVFYDFHNISQCSYRYCPYCGKEVKKEKKKHDNKHRPLCLARVFAYEVGMDLACEDCPIKYCEKRKANER